MKTKRIAVLLSLVSLVVLKSSPSARAASDQLLPDTTKAAFIVPDMNALSKSWNQTQWAALLKHPLMRQFADNLKIQMNEELSKTNKRLGISWDDVKGVATGEVAVGMIQPKAGKHATAMVADVTGNLDRANDLLEKIGDELKEKKAERKANLKEGKIDIVHYSVPSKKGEMMKHVQVYHAIVKNHLVAADHEGVVRDIVKRLSGFNAATGPLANLKTYAIPMAQCNAAAGQMKPHIRWYIEPNGYVTIIRDAADNKQANEKDPLRVLGEQGFDAVKSLGGHLTFATGEHELLHRTYIYAPPVAGAEPGAKFKGAAAMLSFPNAADPKNLAPQPWIPSWTVMPDKAKNEKGAQLAGYTRFNWQIENAFWASGKLVDAMVGKDAFKRMLNALKEDPAGPRIDLPGNIVANLTDRASMLTDHIHPIDADCERWLLAIEIKPDKIDIVKKTIDKWMEHEPDVTLRVFGTHKIWEIQEPPEDGEDDVFDPLEINGVDPIEGDDDENVANEKQLLPNGAVTVAKGHVLIASRIELMKVVLGKQHDTLAEQADYKLVNAALDKLGAGNDSFRLFRRADVAFRPSYELLRQGKMPESRSLLGKILNGIATPQADGAKRKQMVKGKDLPAYKIVQEYLGPGGSYVRSHDDGWAITGCMLKKEKIPKMAKQEK